MTEKHVESVGVKQYGEETAEIGIVVEQYDEYSYQWQITDNCYTGDTIPVTGLADTKDLAIQVAKAAAGVWMRKDDKPLDPSVAQFDDELYNVFDQLHDGLEAVRDWCKEHKQQQPDWINDAATVVDQFEAAWNEMYDREEADDDDPDLDDEQYGDEQWDEDED